MSISQSSKTYLKKLKTEYDTLKKGNISLLEMIDETELPEDVYNSNAIENSTVTLNETEKILLDMELSREISIREVFETKNLSRVNEYIKSNLQKLELSKEFILLIHRMLITNIDDSIAGRFRKQGEYVRVGYHIAPPPQQLDVLMEETISKYKEHIETYFLTKIALFHLEFETIHPFCDGNGRIGRVLLNYQLNKLGLPNIIIRNKNKKHYYKAFQVYNEKKDAKNMEKIIALALMESLHKRIAYLKGKKIITLAEYKKKGDKSLQTLLNSAKRQTIPAFRERGRWKIGL